jgi:hypothetical protein
MLNLVILATALWVCPGEVYTNEPRAGCKPFHQSDREGFSTIQEPPMSPERAAPTPPSPTIRFEQQAPSRPAASSQECELYEEWLSLSMKSTNGLGAHDLTPQEFERWSNLRQMFSVTSPPVCSPPGQ